MGGDLLTDNVRTGNHRRSRSRSVARSTRSRSRGPPMTGRGGSVKAAVKVVDLSAMDSPPSPSATKKSTVATEMSSSSDDCQMRIQRAQNFIQNQQQQGQPASPGQHQQLDGSRGRSRSKSRPRDRESVADSNNSNRGGGRSRSRPRPTHNNTNNSTVSKDTTSLSRAKALLQQMEQQETEKATANSAAVSSPHTPSSRGRTRSPPSSRSARGRTRSPPSSRGRSKSRPRTRPDDMGSTIDKLMDDVNRHRSRSRPRQQQHQKQQQQQHQQQRNANNRQQQRSSRSRSRPPSSNKDGRSARSLSRPREKRSDNHHHHDNHNRYQESKSGQEKRRRSEKDHNAPTPSSPSDRNQRRGSHYQKRNEHVAKGSRKYSQVGRAVGKEQSQSKRREREPEPRRQKRRSSKYSSREEHSNKHRQHKNNDRGGDRSRADQRNKQHRSVSPDYRRDGGRKSTLATRYRSKSPMAKLQPERRVARSKSPYTRGGAQRRNSSRSKSPYVEQKGRRYSNDDDDDDDDESSSSSCSSTHSSCCDSDDDNNDEQQKQTVDRNGCCVYHPFIQLQKKNGSSGEWVVLSRKCAMCLKDAQDETENSLIYIPCGNDEVNRLPSGGSRQLVPMKQGSTSNVTSNALVPHRSEDSFTVTALESEGEEEDDDDTRSVSSRSSASETSSEYDSDDSDNLEESEDEDKSFVSSQRRAGRRPSTGSTGARSAKPNRSGKQSYEKILSSADELLDELMHADMSDSEEKRSKRKAQRRKSSRGKKSPGSSTVERPIDMTKVESALSRIRSMGELSAHGKKESTSPPPVEIVMDLPHTNRNTSKSPIEMDLGSSKSPPPPQQQRNARKPPPPKHQQHSRPPPPPPPPPPPYKHGQSMAVLNPEPEPELEESNHMYPPAQHNYQPQLHAAPPMYQMQPPAQQHSHQQQQSHAPEMHQSPDHDEKAWMKYAIKGAAKYNDDGSKKRERRKSLISGKPNKLANEDSRTHVAVKQMPYTDPVGDFGFYTGQVNENGRPDGKGSMKYDNGIFYEGTWTDGNQDEVAMEQYNRIRGGFTSWKGQGKNAVKTGKTMPWNAHKIDKVDDNDKTNVRGMEWTDLNGDKGRYTGEVNKDELPHGRGIMKYDFGLMAEGEWVNGVLKENPHDRMIAGVGGGMSVAPGMSGGMSVGPGMIGGGMSVGPWMGGGMSVGPGMGGGMSVGPGMPGSVYGGMPQMMMQPQQMMMQQPPKPAQQHAIIAQQNAMMKNAMYTPPGSVFAGGGSVYSGVPTQMMQMPPQQQQIMPMQQQAPPDPSQNPHKPPITEIKLG